MSHGVARRRVFVQRRHSELYTLTYSRLLPAHDEIWVMLRHRSFCKSTSLESLSFAISMVHIRPCYVFLTQSSFVKRVLHVPACDLSEISSAAQQLRDA